MKPSELMLKGFAMAGGRQCILRNCRDNPRHPTAVCAMGSINLALNGNAEQVNSDVWDTTYYVFYDATGVSIVDANDGDCHGQTEPMRIDDIAGILAAEGA